ncbi:MAG: hypothetical protein ATN33_00895 [Epulopiscium sp. Nele67-Bin001]|nr:MAG: hypothetical protein BEN18_01695 [Epulopiscium sp. Nuni2H_MBin001]OON91551.1 MAG: hypothetical protein ATN33_00895 [Epulopiscium sp. Nele67-Bin001]
MQKVYSLDLSAFVNQRRYYIIVLLIATLSGALYAVGLKDNETLMYTINQFVTTQEHNIQLLEVFKNSLLTYTISATLIFIGGLNRNLIPVAVLSFFYTVFSYSFTVTCFLVLYGAKGIIIGLLMIGLQCTLIIGSYLELAYEGVQYSVLQQTKGIDAYSKKFVGCMLVIFGTSAIDAIIQPLMLILIYRIL